MPSHTGFTTLDFLRKTIGPRDTADLTRDLTAAETEALEAFIADHPADFPIHHLAVTALDSDGNVVDKQAFAQLQEAR